MTQEETIEILKAKARNAKKKARESKVLKTSETPQGLTPLEKAKALLRQTDNTYSHHISAKLFPNLDK